MRMANTNVSDSIFFGGINGQNEIAVYVSMHDLQCGERDKYIISNIIFEKSVSGKMAQQQH